MTREPDRVELHGQEGIWIVRIYENGMITERSFTFMQGARAFAEGQAYRLSGSFHFIDETAFPKGNSS